MKLIVCKSIKAYSAVCSLFVLHKQTNGKGESNIRAFSEWLVYNLTRYILFLPDGGESVNRKR